MRSWTRSLDSPIPSPRSAEVGDDRSEHGNHPHTARLDTKLMPWPFRMIRPPTPPKVCKVTGGIIILTDPPIKLLGLETISLGGTPPNYSVTCTLTAEAACFQAGLPSSFTMQPPETGLSLFQFAPFSVPYQFNTPEPGATAAMIVSNSLGVLTAAYVRIPMPT